MDEPLPDELRLALAYTPAAVRAAMHTYFALDQRLARIASGTTEPMLGQMRLAWWRDMLAKPASERPAGDAVLDAIGEHYLGNEPALTDVIDGWEVLIVADMLTGDQLSKYARGRSRAFLSVIDSPSREDRDVVERAGIRWALADAASQVSDEAERAEIVKTALDTRRGGGLPRNLRGLAVLDALAMRALKSGGRPLMEGRGASLTALRAGIFGS
ncbi:squalene/phytoene synthase family protein [Erythrobacter ani]|uniref:Squalene/phytoene synthase family protein n=1 Tax=Erythrobacter ani TaxID=2827235 RepID=A0ABS6SPQ8_9SPHN|nr:squalene/phytoene synthase family protein [Erythrobacter ani]MBV7267028.1 squalene/phytoene synthase family protein [Erythrobacter ani]